MSQRGRGMGRLIGGLSAAAGLAFLVVALPGSGAGADRADVPCTALSSGALSHHSHPGRHRHRAPGSCASTRPISSAAPPPARTAARASAPALPAPSVPVSPRSVDSMPASRTTPTPGTDNGSSQPPRTSVPGAEPMSGQPGFLEVAAAPTANRSRPFIAVALVLTVIAAGVVLVASRRRRRHDDSSASLVGTGEDSVVTDIVPWNHGWPSDQPDRLRTRLAHRAGHGPRAHRGQMTQASARHRADASRN
jgi:hypothetical protein